MGNTQAVYRRIEHDTFEDVEIIKNRDFDCVMVFDIGSAEKDWKAPADGSKINYEYLKVLDSTDKEKRKQLFPQHGADFPQHGQKTKEKDFYKNERKLVIKALTKLHVKTKHIKAMTKEFEADKNLKFYYVGICEKTARNFADKIEYELELEPQSAITYLQLMDEPLAKATVADTHDTKDCLEKHWKNIYIKYDKHVAPEIYKPYDVIDQGDQKDGYEDSLFRIRDRLALINEIVTQDVQLGGCGIFVPVLAAKDHCIVDFYPLHTLEHLHCILEKLFSWKALTYNVLSLPLEEIRSYFGEYIGIYFAYLQFMTIYFVPLAFVGFILQVMQWGEGVVLVDGIQYFALVVILWSVCFPVLWKRKEYAWALKWGTLTFDLKERQRPEFDGVYRKSNVTGGLENYFPHYVRNSRRIVTFAVVVCFLIALFGSVMAVILLRVYVSETNIDYGTYFISIANAFVIMFFNNIYGIFAEKLNEWENYKTETEYENNLIIKIFIFRFINSYATLYYICFFRRYESSSSPLYCDAEDCMEDLAAQLGTIFITQLTVSNAIELGGLAVARCAKGVVTSYFTENEKDWIWAQYSSEIYERTFDDYCEILVAFGYATLFVIAFPLAPLAAFVGCVVEARIDGYKLCKLTRRPFPRQADDVGTWQLAMEVMGWSVLVTNLFIICFAAEDLDLPLGIDDTYFQETLTALILFAILFIAVTCLNYCVAARPHSIDVHVQRQDHLEKHTKEIGNGIDRYLDGLRHDELTGWKQWSPQKVAYYLREVCYKNPAIYQPLESQIRHVRFSGKHFEEADEHLLEKNLGISEHLHKRFVLNARRVLEEQTLAVGKQDAYFIDALTGTQSQRSLSNEVDGGTGRDREEFRFTADNLIQMAEFFEEDLTGQSKRKLWQKVDKDMSSLIEANEMENFLYFSIVVYIKGRYDNVQLPKKSDKRFRSGILAPLQRWMLKYKVSHHGLTFDEFDRYFPSWLREYYREVSAVEAGQGSNYRTLRGGNIDDDDEATGSSSKHISAKVSSNKSKKAKLGKILGANLNIFGGGHDGSGSESEETYYNFGIVNHENWSQQSVDWEKKLDSVAHAINKTDTATRKKIWDKFDRRKVEKLDCDKSLSRLIYSLIALYVKTKNREAKPPKFNLLQPLLQSICADIKLMINTDSGDPNQNLNYITKHEFQTHISLYLKKIAHHRKQLRRQQKRKPVVK